MPVLPSGKIVSLVPQIRLLNAIQAAPSPGMFWIDPISDNLEDPLLPVISDLLTEPRQVPLPGFVEDMPKYITVAVSEAGSQEVQKFNLIAFPPRGFLSAYDMVIWGDWLNSQPVQLYMEMRMLECFDQVEFFDRLKSLGIFKPGEENQAGGFDLLLEKEPLEEKRERHNRYLQRAEEYLIRLKVMQVTEEQSQITWVDLLIEQYGILKTWEDGEDFFGQKYIVYSGQPEFYFAYLTCLFEQGKYQETEEQLWEAVKQFPERADFWELLIRVFLNQQAFEKASEVVNMALAINKDDKRLLDNKFFIDTYLQTKAEDNLN